jgi:hypothetical protein
MAELACALGNLQRLPARGRNAVALELDQQAASFDHFAPLYCESSADKGSKHCDCEPVGEYEPLGGATRIACQEL